MSVFERGLSDDVRPLSYRQLLERLQELTEEQLDMSCTVSFGCDENGNGEFYPVTDTCLSDEGIVDAAADGILDPGTPVLLIEDLYDNDETLAD